MGTGAFSGGLAARGATRACGGSVLLRRQFFFLIGVSLVRLLDVGRVLFGGRLLGVGRILFGVHLLSVGQGFLDQAQDELPLGELPAQAGAFPFQVGFDPLEEFFGDLECQSSSYFLRFFSSRNIRPADW